MSNTIGNDGLPVRDSGIWAKEKLYYLEHYLDIFSVGMHKRWNGKLYYVDLFAGPGRCLISGTKEEFDGSLLIALKFNFSIICFSQANTQRVPNSGARLFLLARMDNVGFRGFDAD